MSQNIVADTINSFEFNEELAHRNEHLIRSMYCAFIKYEHRIPSVSDMVSFIQKYNIDQIAKQQGEEPESDAVLNAYESLEDKNMFVMMDDYVRTIICKSGGAIFDSSDHLVLSGVLDASDRVPDTVVYGDCQNLVLPAMSRRGVCGQGSVLNVKREGIQYLGLGDGS